jgi:hypothetical protein
VRNPDGTDRLLVRDAGLLWWLPITAGVTFPRNPHQIDLEGDVLYNAGGSEPGLWRMPFEGEID